MSSNINPLRDSTPLWDKTWVDGYGITAACLNQIEEVIERQQMQYIFTSDNMPTGQQCVDLLTEGILPVIIIKSSGSSSSDNQFM